jgi:hypothetical protein
MVKTVKPKTSLKPGVQVPAASFRRQQRNRRQPITVTGQPAVLDCEIGSSLLFDVTKRPILGIDNSMNAGLKAIRFISAGVPFYNSELIRPLFMSKMFSLLPLPLFLCRSLPSLFGHRRQPARSYSGQLRFKRRVIMERIWHWELARLARGRSISYGTSCLAVAELSSYKSKKISNVNQ